LRLSFCYTPIVIVYFIRTFRLDFYNPKFIGMLFILVILIDFLTLFNYLHFIKFMNKVTDSIFLIK